MIRFHLSTLVLSFTLLVTLVAINLRESVSISTVERMLPFWAKSSPGRQITSATLSSTVVCKRWGWPWTYFELSRDDAVISDSGRINYVLSQPEAPGEMHLGSLALDVAVAGALVLSLAFMLEWTRNRSVRRHSEVAGNNAMQRSTASGI